MDLEWVIIKQSSDQWGSLAVIAPFVSRDIRSLDEVTDSFDSISSMGTLGGCPKYIHTVVVAGIFCLRGAVTISFCLLLLWLIYLSPGPARRGGGGGVDRTRPQTVTPPSISRPPQPAAPRAGRDHSSRSAGRSPKLVVLPRVGVERGG